MPAAKGSTRTPLGTKFCSRRWGSSLPGLRKRDPQLGTPLTWAEIFCRVTFKHLPQLLRTHIQSLRKKISLVSMRGWAEGLACADPGARTPIGASGIEQKLSIEYVISLIDVSMHNISIRKCYVNVPVLCLKVRLIVQLEPWILLTHRNKGPLYKSQLLNLMHLDILCPLLST